MKGGEKVIKLTIGAAAVGGALITVAASKLIRKKQYMYVKNNIYLFKI